MADSSHELLDEAFSRLQGLRTAVAELGPRVRHAHSARFLWNLILSGTKGLIAQLRVAPTGAVALPDLIRGIEGPADALHILLSLVEAGAAERVHQAIVPSLHHLVSDLVPDAKVLVCSDWLPSNYSFQQRFPRKLEAAVQQSVTGDGVPDDVQRAAHVVPKVFAVLSFPVSERDNALLHAALGHEVGHGLVELHSVPRLDMPPDLATSASPSLRGVSLRELYQLVRTWLRELVADAWAIALMGPAPLMSIYSLGRADPPDDDHPASHYRFLLMRECLRRTGHLAAGPGLPDMQWLPDKVEAALEASRAATTSPDLPAAALAHRILEHNTCGIAEFVLGKIKELAPHCLYSAERWDRECNVSLQPDARHHDLVYRILHHCPPDTYEAQLNDGIPSLASILNAGWAVLLSPNLWAEFCDPFGDAGLRGDYTARQKLQGLVLKAVEICGVRREWEASR